MKRKPSFQPSLAPLSDAEKEQLADWLRKETYEAVHARVTKSREEGGFGLKISIRPLQTYHAKVLKLDDINTRIKNNPKLSMTDYESIAAGERTDITEEVHDAIM